MAEDKEQMEEQQAAESDVGQETGFENDFDDDAAEAAAMVDAEADAAADAALDGIYSDDQAALIIAAAEVAELKDKLLRAVAETENVRRRGKRDQDDARKFAVTEFARDMLSVADNLERAVASVSAEARSGNSDVASLLDGVQLTARELAGTLERHGIEVIDPKDEKLDPNRHQAVLQIEDPEVAVGTVVRVMQVGYVLNGRLLRPAMVGIAKGGPAPEKIKGIDTKA